MSAIKLFGAQRAPNNLIARYRGRSAIVRRVSSAEQLRYVPGRRARRECARAAEPSPHDAKAGAAKMQFRHAPETPPRPLLSRIKCVSYYCGEEKGKKSARKGGKGGVLFRGTGAGAAARNVGQSRLCGARNVRGAWRRNRISGARAYVLPERSA